MVVALVQPYFFPYIGYFQLMQAVDVFVLYDDAQFMKGGWVNRNRILSRGKAAWWTLPVSSDRFTLPINRRSYAWSGKAIASLAGKVEHAYRGAPEFAQVFGRLKDRLQEPIMNVAAFNQRHLQHVANDLDLQCRFITSSALGGDTALSGQDRVIDLCKRAGATRYVNPIGGFDLYDTAAFDAAGIELGFLRARPTSYAQLDQPHVPFLSIVDVLMFNAADQARALLREYDLVAPKAAA